MYSTTFGYRTDLVGETPPSSIHDVFDLEKYPGKRSLEKKPINNFEWALLADGVAADRIYEVLSTKEGVARALAKLDTIKDHVVVGARRADTATARRRGSDHGVDLQRSPVLGDRGGEAAIAMMWDWQVFDLDGWIIPMGGKNEDDVRKFLHFATDTQRLADQAKFISYGPTRASSAPLVSTHATLGIEMAPHMPTSPENAKNTLLYNYEFWADNIDDLTERFQAWLAL